MFELLSVSPATGDHSNLTVYIVIAVLAVAAAVTAAIVTNFKKKP